MAENNKVIGNGPVIGNISKKLNLNIKNGSVTTDKIAAKAVTIDKLGDDATQYLRDIIDESVDEQIIKNDGIFDISRYNATGSTLKSYASLSAALADVPSSKRRGGINIMYMDSTISAYRQYRLIMNTWTAAPGLWVEILPQTITSAEMDTVLGGSSPVYLVDANGVAVLDNNGNPIEII